MRRREVLGALVLGLAPQIAHAQSGRQIYRLALVHAAFPIDAMTQTGWPPYAAFFAELKRLGYAEGENLIVDRYSAEGRPETFGDMVRQVLASKPDTVFAVGVRLVQQFRAQTQTIPIVALASDPVKFGFAQSLSRPGANVTGISSDAGVEVFAKFIELLREVVPQLSKLGFVAPAEVWQTSYGPALRQAADRHNISIVGQPLQSPINEGEYRRVLSSIREEGAKAVLVSDVPENQSNSAVIISLTAATRLPALHPAINFVRLGGLMAYAPDGLQIHRRAADYVAKVLGGAKPADLPFEQPTTYRFAVNLKTASALGLTIPASLVTQADEVIE